MPRCPQSLSLKGTVFSSPTYFHAWWWWWCLPCAHLLLLTHSFSFPLYFFSPMMLQPPSLHLPPLFIDATLSSQSLLLILKYLWLLTHPPPLPPHFLSIPHSTSRPHCIWTWSPVTTPWILHLTYLSLTLLVICSRSPPKHILPLMSPVHQPLPLANLPHQFPPSSVFYFCSKFKTTLKWTATALPFLALCLSTWIVLR